MQKTETHSRCRIHTNVCLPVGPPIGIISPLTENSDPHLHSYFFKLGFFKKISVHMETLGEKKHAKTTDGDEAILRCAARCQKKRQRFPSLMLQDKNQVVKTFTLEGVFSIAWFSVI